MNEKFIWSNLIISSVNLKLHSVSKIFAEHCAECMNVIIVSRLLKLPAW